MKKLTKKERNDWYYYMLEKLAENHYSAPFLCHVISYKRFKILSGYSVDKMKAEFEELSFFMNNEESGFFTNDSDIISGREFRALILMFCIEMTKNGK
jgi:hypothetical protein